MTDTVETVIARAIGEMPESILEMYERPGGPPGNGWRRVTSADIAASVIAALDAAGYVIAPREPTPLMRMAAMAAAEKVNPWRDSDHIASVALDSQSIYRAMLAAAREPSP